MNKNIKLAVAGAVLALSATAANAGIVIPAGDWSLDVSGNVNMYDSWSKANGKNTVTGGLVNGAATGYSQNSVNGLANGLLPNFLGFTGSTRQNDLDVSFTISLQPGSGVNAAGTTATSNATTTSNNGGFNNRQMFITFGDKSWGSVKVGKDLGIFASDAILSDMTLLGVGSAATQAGNTSLGRIGSGYIYADWKPQIAYTTPNFSGFQATAGITQAWISGSNTTTNSATADITSSSVNASPAYEGKASYSFAANGVDGKVWVSGISQRIGSFGAYNDDKVAYAGDIGAKLSVAGAEVVGYYYGGTGIGTTLQFGQGYGIRSGGGYEGRDSYGGYVQATYVLPTKTKVGISWGESNLDKASGDALTTLVRSNEMTTVGLYHPLTKHLNLVAEYSYVRSENQASQENHQDIGSLGAILFF